MKLADPKITFGFGTLNEPIPTEFKSDWDALRPKWRQIHGTTVVTVESTQQDCGDTDGLITTKMGTPIGIVTADCVPVLMASLKKPLVGAFHAGWKGTKAKIVTQWLETHLEKTFHLKPKDMIAWVGPSIGPCCYEVGEDLFKNFKSEFNDLPLDLITPKFRHLDLGKIHELQLKNMGFQHVEVVRECTKCTLNNESKNWKYASYRRDGTGVRQYTMIRID